MAPTATDKSAPKTPKAQLIATGLLPDAVVRDAAEAFGRVDLAGFSHARHLPADVTVRLYGRDLPVAHASAFCTNVTDASVADHIVVVAGERRDGPLMNLLGRWYLGADTQKALAKRGLKPETASKLLDGGVLAPPAKAPLMRHLPVDQQAQWLATDADALDVDTVWELLVELAPHTGALCKPSVDDDHLTRVLRLRPELLDRVHLAEDLHRSGGPVNLLVAASAVGLTETQQHAVLDTVLSAPDVSFFDRRGAVLANLLDDPGTCLEVRADAWKVAVERYPAELAKREVPAPSSPLAAGTPIDKIDDPAVLDLLLVRSTRPHWNDGRPWQWLDMASNPHLDDLQVERLGAKLEDLETGRGIGYRFLLAALDLISDRSELARGLNRTNSTAERRNELRTYLEARDAAMARTDTQLWDGSTQVRLDASLAPRPEFGATQVLSTFGTHWGSNPRKAAVFLRAHLGEDRGRWQTLLATCDSFHGTVDELVHWVDDTAAA